MAAFEAIGVGIYRQRHPLLDLNVGAVVGADGVALIDSGASHRQAERIIDALRAVTLLPVRWVVNTHHHWDHCYGNSRFGDAQLWGHVRCRRWMVEQAEATRRSLMADADPEQRSELAEVMIVPPSCLLRWSTVLDLGDREIRLRHLGRGHTSDDVVVVVPDAGVVFAGDLVEEGAPPDFEDAYPREWPDTLSALLEMVAGPVVPGHGSVVEKTFVARQCADIRSVVEAVEAALADGVPTRLVEIPDAPFPPATVRAVAERMAAV